MAARKAVVVFVVGKLLKVPRGFNEIEESMVDTKVEKDWALTRLIVWSTLSNISKAVPAFGPS